MFALFPWQQKRSICSCRFKSLSSLSQRASGLGGARVSVLSQSGDTVLAWAWALSCPRALLEELLSVPACVQQLLCVQRARMPCWPQGLLCTALSPPWPPPPPSIWDCGQRRLPCWPRLYPTIVSVCSFKFQKKCRERRRCCPVSVEHQPWLCLGPVVLLQKDSSGEEPRWW